MLDGPAPPRTKNPFSAGNQVAVAKKLLICMCASLPAILPICETADTLSPTRRFGLKAMPPLTMLRATSPDLSVAPRRASSKLTDCPFSLNFAPNPAPRPVPTYQWDHMLSDLSASAAADAGANPAIAQDKPPIATMRQNEFIVSPLKRLRRRSGAHGRRAPVRVFRSTHPTPDLSAAATATLLSIARNRGRVKAPAVFHTSVKAFFAIQSALRRRAHRSMPSARP